MSSFQERLVQIGRDFEKLVHRVNVPRGALQRIRLVYKGLEQLDGIHHPDNSDVYVEKVTFNEDGHLIADVVVKASANGNKNNQLVFYFDPSIPFYLKNEDGRIEVNTRKLKQTVTIQTKGEVIFDKDKLTFTDVSEGDLLEFSFLHKGTDKIQGVKGSCGCTNVYLDGDLVKGALDTTGFKPGYFSKHINVYYGEYERIYNSVGGVLKQSPEAFLYTLTIDGTVK